MRLISLLVRGLVGSVSAQYVSFFIPGGYQGVVPVATIQAVNPSTTQFHVACPTGAKRFDCDWNAGADVTIISNTRYQLAVSYDRNTMSVGCDYSDSKLVCTASMSGGDNTNPAQTATLSGSAVAFAQASVVSGVSLLSTRLPTQAPLAQAGHAPAETTVSSPVRTGAASKYGLHEPVLLVLAGAVALLAV